MTRQKAQEILLLYRPGTLDAQDPEVAKALEFAKNDPALTVWLEQHQLFQAAVRATFRRMEAPEPLRIVLSAPKEVLLPQRKFWQSRVWVAAAGALVLFAVGFMIWREPALPDRFWNYRELMVRKAMRGYSMESQTQNMRQFRDWVSTRSTPRQLVAG